MIARVTVTRGGTDKMPELTRFIQDQIIPSARKQRGFKGGYWLADRKSGKALTVTLWESAEAEQGSQTLASQVRSQAASTMGVKTDSVEVYEVIAQA
jgi:type IV pilus biogenesis protein CpaD/CtpE